MPEDMAEDSPLLGSPTLRVSTRTVSEDERGLRRSCCGCCAHWPAQCGGGRPPAESGTVSVQMAVDGAGKQLSLSWWSGAVTMTWASFCFGMLFGSLSPVLGTPDACARGERFFNCELGLDTATQSLWILVGPLGTVALGPFGGAGLDRFGHQRMLLGAGLMYVLGWASFAVTPGTRGLWNNHAQHERVSLWLIFGGRMLTWSGFAFMCGVPGIYLAEISPRSVRGAAGASCAISIMLGTLCEFGLGAVLEWRWLYAANGAFFLPVLLLSLCLPPSPRWLHQKLHAKRQDQERPALLRKQQQAGAAGSGDDSAAEVRRAVRRLYRASDARDALVEAVCKEILLTEDTTKEAAGAAAAAAAAAGGGGGGEAAHHLEDAKGESCQQLWHMRLPVAMCGTLALVMQLCPGGTAAVQFSGPILDDFAPEQRNLIALLCNTAALPGCLIALFLADRSGYVRQTHT